MADQPSKILVLGSAQGAISTLFSKLKTFNAKHGPFDAVFCVGDFFSPTGTNEGLEDLLDGKIPIPTPTFVLSSPNVASPPAVVAKASDPSGELCPNLLLLVGKGRVTIPGRGVHLAYSTGAEPLGPADFEQVETTHLLLTHSHPSVAMPSLPGSSGDTDADLLLKHVRPRYAFSGSSGVFKEREPFGWGGEEWTRCVALGSLAGTEGGKKQRWYYAFSISPLLPLAHPTNPTPNPYLNSPEPATIRPAQTSNGKEGPSPPNKRKFEAIAAEESSIDFRWGGDGKTAKRGKIDHTGKPPPGYKCRICDSSEHYVQACPQKLERDEERARNRETDKPPEGYKCRKCGSSEHFVRNCPEASQMGDTGGPLPPDGYVCRACGGGKHYFKDCEVAAKGRNERGHGGRKEIGPDECWFCLSNPKVTKHLIVSIGTETYLTLPRGSLIPPLSPPSAHTIPGGGHVLIIPISHYPTLLSLPSELSMPIISEIESYKSALRALFRSKGCGAVVWEIGRLSGRGGHAHVQIVPIPLHLSDAAEEAFRTEGEYGGVDWEEDTDAAQTGGNYLRVELPNGTRLLHAIKPGPPFNLQFGRMVLAKILGLTERTDWKACAETEDEEKEAAQRFKTAFAAFDPTLK